MYKTKAYSAASATSPLGLDHDPATRPDRTRRADRDPLLRHLPLRPPLRCATSGSDVMPTVYPCVPGHEIVGRVTKVGSAVTKFKAGDLVGVGCLVDSDRTCPNCRAGLEQFCPNQALTYGSPDKHGTAPVTYGGYSDSIVVDERFRPAHPAEPRPRRGRAAAVRGHHDLLADAPLGRRRRARRSASSASAGWATWA